MKQLFFDLIDPITASLLLITFFVISCLIINFIEAKKLVRSFERFFIFMFLTIISGCIIFPFNLLNPSSLVMVKTNLISFTVISQAVFYSLVIFLLRSQLRYLYPSIYFLLKNHFLTGLLSLIALSCFWSETPLVTLKASLVLLSLSIVAAYTAFQYSFQEIFKIVRWTGTFITILGSGVSILIPSIGISLEKNGAWNGILGHPNVFAAWMAFTSALWCLNAMVSSKHRWLSISLSILSLLVMFRAKSGASIVVSITMFSVLGIFEIFKHLKFRQAIVTLIFLIISLIFSGIFVSVGKEWILSLLGRDETLSGRTYFWNEVIKSILNRPVLGYGYEGFWQSWRGADNPAAHLINPNGFVPTVAHNGYLELALYVGISGIILFLLSLIFNVTRIRFSRKYDAEICILMLVFILIPSLSETGFWGMTDKTFLYVFLSARLNIDAYRKIK